MIEILCHSEPEALVLEIVGDVGGAGPVLLACLVGAMEADVDTIVVDLGGGALDPVTGAALQQAAAAFAVTGGVLRLRGDEVGLAAVAADGTRSTPRRPRPQARLAVRSHS